MRARAASRSASLGSSRASEAICETTWATCRSVRIQGWEASKTSAGVREELCREVARNWHEPSAGHDLEPVARRRWGSPKEPRRVHRAERIESLVGEAEMNPGSTSGGPNPGAPSVVSSRRPYDPERSARELEEKLAAAQLRADHAAELAQRKADRAAAIRSRLRIQERKARTRQLIQIGGVFVRAAGGELTVQQAGFIAEKLAAQKLESGKTLMETLVAMARKKHPVPESGSQKVTV